MSRLGFQSGGFHLADDSPAPVGGAAFHDPQAEDWGCKFWNFDPHLIGANIGLEDTKANFQRMRCDTVETVNTLYFGSWTFALPPGLDVRFYLYTVDRITKRFTKRLELLSDGSNIFDAGYLRAISMGGSYTLDGTEIPYGAVYTTGPNMPTVLRHGAWNYTSYVVGPTPGFNTFPIDNENPMSFKMAGAPPPVDFLLDFAAGTIDTGAQLVGVDPYMPWMGFGHV